jgi:putative membrane protein
MSRTPTYRKQIAVLAFAASGALACAPAERAAIAGALPGAPEMTNADVTGVVQTVNDGQIMTSQAAIERATAAAVREFAQRMVADHTAANERLAALEIGAAQAQMARDLAESAQAAMQALAQYEGEAFDRAYLAAQIELHEYKLNTLDATLIPSATDRRLIAELERIRGEALEHLEQARQIRRNL